MPSRSVTVAAGEATRDRPPWWAPLFLVTALAAAYSNTFQCEFVFDDGSSIQRNPSIRNLWPLSSVLWPGVEKGRTIDGRPLLNLSLALNYAVSGLDVWSYHALNLLVHIGATLMLFGLVRRTLLLPQFRDSMGPHATGLACAIALVWGLHPLNTESVTYVVQRAESLLGLFYLATLYCVARGEASPRQRVWWVAAVVACLAGMATKEVMVTAPVVVLIYLWVFAFGTLDETLRRRWPLLVALASTWLLLGWLIVAHGGRGGTVDLDAPLTPARYAAMQLVAVVHYLQLSLSPRPLVFDYGRQLLVSDVRVMLSGLVLMALAAGTAWALVRRPWIGFLGSTFFLILLPSSSVVPIITQVMAEHRMYLPLAAVVSLAVLIGWLGWQRLASDSPPVCRNIRGCAACLRSL